MARLDILYNRKWSKDHEKVHKNCQIKLTEMLHSPGHAGRRVEAPVHFNECRLQLEGDTSLEATGGLLLTAAPVQHTQGALADLLPPRAESVLHGR